MLLLLSLVITGCAVDISGTDRPGDDSSFDESDDDDVATDDDDAATDDDDASDDDDAAPVFAPKAGDWIITSAALTLDECGLEGFMDRGQPGSIFQLDNTGALNFDLTFGGDEEGTSGGGEVLPCLLDENSLDYECGASLSERDLNDEFALNAIIHVEMSAWGDFNSETRGSLTTQVALSCEGNCGLVQFLLATSFPCSMVNETQVEPVN